VIVVTGSTGVVGGLVARELARRGERFRLASHHPERAPDLPGAEVVRIDYSEPASLTAVLREGDRVFMVSMHEPYERRLPLHRSFVAAAAAAGVGYVAYLSFFSAATDAVFKHARGHGATEELLRETGIPFAAVRNGMYGDLIWSWFDATGAITGPGGEGRVAFSYRPELAEAIAVALIEPGHVGVLNIGTPESVTLAELARIASDVTGDAYRYEPLAPEAWKAKRVALGRKDWEVEAGLSSYEAVRAGEFDVVTDDYHRLTGKQPLTVRELIERQLDEMPLHRA
jgi:uncharacterized protein YbjT (DUF2867 family)